MAEDFIKVYEMWRCYYLTSQKREIQRKEKRGNFDTVLSIVKVLRKKKEVKLHNSKIYSWYTHKFPSREPSNNKTCGS